MLNIFTQINIMVSLHNHKANVRNEDEMMTMGQKVSKGQFCILSV